MAGEADAGEGADQRHRADVQRSGGNLSASCRREMMIAWTRC